jgi:hypothetical protein
MEKFAGQRFMQSALAEPTQDEIDAMKARAKEWWQENRSKYLKTGRKALIDRHSIALKCHIEWGEPKDGVSCGIAWYKSGYTVGQKGVISVYLRSTRPDELKCRAGYPFSWRIGEDGTCRIAVVVDALGGQYAGGKEYTLPTDTVVEIQGIEFSAEPSVALASHLHFKPGRTPVRVVCMPMFWEVESPTSREKWEGTESGTLTVDVVEKKGK